MAIIAPDETRATMGRRDATRRRAWLKDRVAGYKFPDFRILAALPTTDLGKLKKQQLADRLAKEIQAGLDA